MSYQDMKHTPVEARYIPFPMYPMHDYSPSDIRGIICIKNLCGTASYIIVQRPIFNEGIYHGSLIFQDYGFVHPFSIDYGINWGRLTLYISSQSIHTYPYFTREACLTFKDDGQLIEYGTSAYSEEEMDFIRAIAHALNQGIQKQPPHIDEESDTLATVIPGFPPILHYIRKDNISDVFIRYIEYDDSDNLSIIEAYVYHGIFNVLYMSYDESPKYTDLEKAGIMRWSTHEDLVYQPSMKYPYPVNFSKPLSGKELPEDIQQILPSLPLAKEFITREKYFHQWSLGEENPTDSPAKDTQ